MSSAAAVVADDVEDPLSAPARAWWLELGSVVPRSVAYTYRAARPDASGIPKLQPSPLTWATVAVDELALSAAYLRSRSSGKVVEASTQDNARRAIDALDAVGAIADPTLLYPAPSLPSDLRSTHRSSSGTRFEQISFESQWRPAAELGVDDVWSAPHGNSRVHAYLLRHGDRPRPWALMIHGTMMGEPRDIRFLGSARIHRELGVDVAHLVLPMHGPRSRESGHPFPGLDPVLNLVGMTQSIADARALLAWLRAEGDGRVGVFGISLGGHVAGLLAGFEADLDCVIAGVPTSDHSTMLADTLSSHWGADALDASHVLDEAPLALSRLVSPLSFAPVVPHDRRFIYAAIGDRLVTPQQAEALWQHWDQPTIKWMQGAHIVNNIRGSRRFVADALRSSGVTGV